MNREEFVSKYKVGDKVRLIDWKPEHYLKILSVGDKSFFCRHSTGYENVYAIDHDWILYTEPQKKKTVKMAQAVVRDYAGGYSLITEFYSSKEEVERDWDLHAIIQWPLVINGCEQWITVEVEE